MSSSASEKAVFEYDRDAIRVKARLLTNKSESSSSSSESEMRKFSVDPNLTSYETLRSLLSRAFDLTDDLDESFRISYYCANEWLPMLSDWDLDAAVISASDPCLQLALIKASQRDKVNLRGCVTAEAKVPNSEPAISPTAAAAQEAIHQLFVTSKQSFLKSTIPALTTKLQRMVTSDEQQPQQSQPQSQLNPPLSDREFRSFLDNVGELVRPRELRIGNVQHFSHCTISRVVSSLNIPDFSLFQSFTKVEWNRSYEKWFGSIFWECILMVWTAGKGWNTCVINHMNMIS